MKIFQLKKCEKYRNSKDENISSDSHKMGLAHQGNSFLFRIENHLETHRNTHDSVTTQLQLDHHIPLVLEQPLPCRKSFDFLLAAHFTICQTFEHLKMFNCFCLLSRAYLQQSPADSLTQIISSIGASNKKPKRERG